MSMYERPDYLTQRATQHTFDEEAVLITTAPGVRGDDGRWQEGVATRTTIQCATAPGSTTDEQDAGASRVVEIRMFWVDGVMPEPLYEAAENAEIEYGGRTYRVRKSKDWKDFYEVEAEYAT